MLATESLIKIIDRIRRTIPLEYVPGGTTLVEFIDPGHGGFIQGEYVTAPDKMWDHGEFVFYEGLWNRALAWMYALDLYTHGLGYYIVAPGHKDFDRSYRCNMANAKAKTWPGKKTYYHAIHGNAFGLPSEGSNNAAGIEVYTSPGQTDADPIATACIFNLREALGWRMRTDPSDGDPDKEARFTVLIKTDMPALLSENGFFSNFAECKKMLEYRTMQLMASAFLETHLTVLHKNLLR
jgi:N-acetylmuramoyl-L-alanine amidase